MIKLLRVDHRLLHGQVAVAWYSVTGANTILIANDEVAKDDMRKKVIRMAKPANAKLVMKDVDSCIYAINNGLTDKYDMLVVVENITDAYRLIKGTNAISSLNLGGTKVTEKTKNVTKTINITTEEEILLKKLIDKGVEIEVRQVPSEKKQLIKKLI